jgi:hypothetical protein
VPETQYLSALWTVLRAHHRRLVAGEPAGDEENPRAVDAGDIVQYVVITAALAIAAVAVVAIIVAKITDKATGLQTE